MGLKNVEGIYLPREGCGDVFGVSQAITEPFSAGRSVSRLLFDFSVIIALFKPDIMDHTILDFGAGTGWVSEFCARMGHQVVSFDIHGNLKACLEGRICSDKRIDQNLMGFSHGDGHAMPFENDVFGHLLCYDTLHHMYDYPKVFAEFYRTLRKGGRAIFVEPGASHSTSPETIAFVEEQKKYDDTWIERDIVLEDIDKIAVDAGFVSGITVLPMPHPLALQTYSLNEWKEFRNGNELSRLRLTDMLAKINYDDRVIFYIDKP